MDRMVRDEFIVMRRLRTQRRRGGGGVVPSGRTTCHEVETCGGGFVPQPSLDSRMSGPIMPVLKCRGLTEPAPSFWWSKWTGTRQSLAAYRTAIA